MAVVARELVQEPVLQTEADQPLVHLYLVETPALAAERAWPAWIIGSSIVGTVAGLLYVAAVAG